MLTVAACLSDLHDIRLVVLAATICSLASASAIQLYSHASRTRTFARWIWLLIAATACGFGIWATHFIAMIAYEPGLPSGYSLSPTLLSLVYAITLTGLGLAVPLAQGGLATRWLGGMIVGAGIGAMHYTGMAGYQIGGRLSWDTGLVVASMTIGMVFGGIALSLTGQRPTFLRQAAATVALLLAICGLHFTGMTAVAIAPDPTVAVTPSAIPVPWMAAGVAVASLVLFTIAAVAVWLDLRERQHLVREEARLRSLANAAVEGLLVCDGERIVGANTSFQELVGNLSRDFDGAMLSEFLTSEATRNALVSRFEQSVEGELRRDDGDLVPVELIARPLAHLGEFTYAIAIRDLRARRKAESDIQFLALHDSLTRLPNRANFTVHLEQYLQAAHVKKTRVAVLLFDIDRFKEVNDLFGHARGDKALQDIGRLIKGLLGENQTIARLGGDKFAIATPIDHAASASRLAETMLAALKAESGLDLSISIGIAIFPDDTTDRNELLNFADTALYRAKADGRATFRFYEDRLGQEVRSRRRIEHELRHAVARNELKVVFQPQHRIETKELVGFEALLRWRHPELGQVSPAIFIPIAEESGLIVDIGAWVLKTACAEAAKWSRPLSIAVNVSANQLYRPDFSRLVHETLVETGLSPTLLEIEITETALIHDPARALLSLRQAKALGVSIAMDDFGTGYSSLSNLRQFPFDKIKIDASFIRAVDHNPEAAAIVRSVLGLARGLGLRVVAEGVETVSELDFLVREACDQAQGYLLGRPADIEVFATQTVRSEDLPNPMPRAVAAA